MPSYPSNYNGPSLSVNNVTNRTELRDVTNSDGTTTTTEPTDTLGDVATAINTLLTEIYQIKDQLPEVKDIADPSGLSGTDNANLTTSDRAWLANAYGNHLSDIKAKCMALSYTLNILQGQINTAVGGSGDDFNVVNYPSDYGRGY